MARPTIAIIGAGFSGTLLALHLLRRCPSQARIVLIERNTQFGRGQAYAIGNPSHLLNVPAARMSAFHDQPKDFTDWLDRQPEGAALLAQGFVPRRLFGAYVRSLLNEEVKRPENDERLELLRGDAVGLTKTDAGITIALDGDRWLPVDLAVLAIGNFPPEPPAAAEPSFLDSRFYRADPWASDTFADLPPDAPVLLIAPGRPLWTRSSRCSTRGTRGRSTRCPAVACCRIGTLRPRRSRRRQAPFRPLWSS